MKFPFIQLFVHDHTNDEKLALCSLATFGLWTKIVCAMHLADRSGVMSGTLEYFSRLGRCSVVEASSAIDELSKTNAADVTFNGPNVTLVNRRMRREWKTRNQTRLRVEKVRNKEPVTHAVTQLKRPRDSDCGYDSDSPPKEKGSGEKPIPKAEEVLLAYLNEKTGRDFRLVSANLAPIRLRLAEVGGDVDGIRQMIDRQCACWKCTDQEEYLRPETLFGKTKFHGYYGAKAMPVKPNGQKNGSRQIRHADAYENLENRPQRPLL